MGPVLRHLTERISTAGCVLLAVIDPDKQCHQGLLTVARSLERGGADAILLGGSSGADGEPVSEAARRLKGKLSIPVICVPGNVGGLTRHADAVLYLSVMNTDSAYWGVEARVLMAALIKRHNMEVIPTSYVLLEEGETAAWVSQARVIPRRQAYLAELCALAGEYSGSRFCLLDSGSNSSCGIPLETIRRTAGSLSTPLIYAGGIRGYDQATDAIEAGASGLQVGTFFEKADEPQAACALMRAAMLNGIARRQRVAANGAAREAVDGA